MAILLGYGLLGPLGAQTQSAVRLWSGAAPGSLGDADQDHPTLIPYPVDTRADVSSRCPAVLVCPGGGYGGLAMDHEGHQIARWWNENGVSAFILNYRHRGKGYGHPAPLQDAQRALRMIRARAAEWRVDPTRIGVMGFSAGGHLAASLGTHFDSGQQHDDPIQQASCRPDFMVLCYPVIAFDEPYTHQGSQRNLLGPNAPADLIQAMSLEKQVSPDSPPTFLFHTDADRAVPAENSVVFYLALRKAKVPAELHIFQEGRHGVGLAADIPSTRAWPAACLAWLQQQQILPAAPARSTTVPEPAALP